ncbi:MAG: aldehyde ferredoxin oxidoreductase family protein, partial [Candidatus Bathyarchaeia archaeon]
LLGGKGLGALLLYKKTEKEINPLSPQNPLIFATGPLTGTSAPGSSKFCVVTKSPATGTIDDSYCGGFFGSELKMAGYDALVLLGRAAEPSILIIQDSEVYSEPASDLWGMFTADTEKALKERLGGGYRFVEIGPAGERKAPIAGIFSEMRAAGRGGAGAVMGSKNLKAIAVKGTGTVRVHDPDEFREAVWKAHRALRMEEVTVRSMPIYGTVNIVETINETGALPTRNFQTGRFEAAEDISGESFRSDLWKKDFACSLACPITCSKFAVIEDGPFKGVAVDGPDYETIFSLGSNCGVKDRAAITYANLLCDLYGIDTISTGVIVSFVMELYQKGLMKADDLEGIEARWGDPGVLVELVDKIAKGEGVGEFLQFGVKKISERYPGSESYAMHVKGLEVPGYDPRAAQGMGLCYAVSERGACHLRAYTVGRELLGHAGGADPFTYDRMKVQMAIDRQDEKAVVDSAVLCYFTLFGMRLKEVHQMLVSCTGFNYPHFGDLMTLGARVITLTRIFNVREGFTRKDDALPSRFLEEPMPEGPAKGMVTQLEPMLKAYYEIRGWDENGIPKEETLEKLDLKSLIT